MKRVLTLVLAMGIACFAACGGQTAPTDASAAGSGATASSSGSASSTSVTGATNGSASATTCEGLPAVSKCGFDPAFAPIEAGATQTRCVAGRMALKCNVEGATETCLSDDDSNQCPGVTNGPQSCTSQCCGSEYGVVCEDAVVPPGCRLIGGPDPGFGGTTSCCPCQ